MKYILVIGDGMADNPVESLGGRTPIEAADIRFIDSLAEKGELGQVKNCPDGFAPGSDVAIMSILGCAPALYYAGRAPLEAAAQGVKLKAGDAAFRCNNVSLSEAERFEDRLILSHSGGGIEGAKSKELIEYLFAHPEFKALADELGMEVYPIESYRHIAVKHDTDITGIELFPPHDHKNEKVGDNLPGGCACAGELRRLIEKSVEILGKHPINIQREAEGKLPANAIWFWAEGTAATLPSFNERYRMSGGLVSAVPLCHGIGNMTGMDVIMVPGATGELHTNYEGKVTAALDYLKEHDFVAVHLEGPDECTHDKNLDEKIQAIEWLSGRVVEPLVKGLEREKQDFRMLILSDHKTLMANGAHDGDPVPYIMYDSRKATGSGLKYSEKNGEAGPYVDDGTKLLNMLFEL